METTGYGNDGTDDDDQIMKVDMAITYYLMR